MIVRKAVGRISAFQAALLAVAVGLSTATLGVALVPGLGVALVNAELDLMINSVATLIAGGVSALAWTRWREAHDVAALYESSAFLVLFVSNLAVVVASITPARDDLGLTLTDPGQLPIYALGGSRLVAAVLLAIGGLSALRRWRPARPPAAVVLLGPITVLLMLIGLGVLVRESLPPLLSDGAIEALRRSPTEPVAQVAGPLTILQASTGVIYVAAAYYYFLLHTRERQPLKAYLSIGLIVAAFSQVHFGLHPGIYSSLVTTGDLLRVGFYGLLLIGIDADLRADIRALRQANEELVHLHEAEVTRAALVERARLAREVHDGLAQDLWYAKLKQGRLARMDELGDAARTLVAEVQSAIDSALSEARQAVMALRSSPRGDSFADTLHRYVEDFGDRFGLRAEFEASGDFAPLGVRAQAEMLRIMQEALNNVSKHADATVLRVRALRDDDGVALMVVDNGRGFDPAQVDPGRFGLVSMRERAALIGGMLTVESAHQDGTTVTFRVPLQTDARATDA